MKRLFTLCFIICLLIICSCNSSQDLTKYISQYRDNIFVGETDNISLTCFSENRESPFIADANVGDLNNQLIFKLASKGVSLNNISISISFSNYTYQGSFTYNPINSNLLSTIPVKELPNENIVVKIKTNELEDELILESTKLNSTINYKTALNSVIKYDKSLINNLFNKKPLAEIHIRLLEDDNKNYYYVGFAKSDGKIIAYLVDGENSKVLAKKII